MKLIDNTGITTDFLKKESAVFRLTQPGCYRFGVLVVFIVK
jgi:hypothetical protein